MLPWEHVATARVPGSADEMRLSRRGDEYSIRVGAYELMNSRQHASEETFATAVCERLSESARASILIGGLGMSFTLRAVLDHTGRQARIDVAELMPEVIEWNRGPLAALSKHAMADPRVQVHRADVANLVRAAAESYDAILLDVDNGPAALTTPGNDWLYSAAGLRALARALKNGGLLAIWSSTTDAAFRSRLEKSGFRVEELKVRGHTKARGPHYVIWIARPVKAV